jgi:tetratricopeptide (TPR) repeat protein
VALEHLGRHQEADEAFARALKSAAAAPGPLRTRLRWVHGFAVAGRLPDRARQAFEEVLREDPANPQALYGCAMLLEREGRPEQALSFYNRALEASPSFSQARRFRAVLLARRGDFGSASRDINWCLETDRRSGAAYYAAACVAALMAEQTTGRPAREAGDQAVRLLGRAFERGYGRDRAAGDRDLEGIRRHPGYRRLLADVPPQAGGGEDHAGRP